MTPEDNVDTLLFDVLGTVVDEAGSMQAELTAALDQVGAAGQAADVERAGEGTPDPTDTFDVTAPDLATLAEILLARHTANPSNASL
jgi:hypothetical protein